MLKTRSEPQKGNLFLGFFYLLRARGLMVTPKQWLTLLEGCATGLHGSSLMGFYSLARSILIRDESELDDFDIIFSEYFSAEGAQITSDKNKELEEEILSWLKNPIEPFQIDPTLQQFLDKVDVEALREEFEKRLQEQKEKHDGGGHWIGTGGTSPFGHSGYHPGGIRVGGEGRNGSAVQIASARRFRELRKDRVLDTRQLSIALKKLRLLKRTGAEEELDVESTIDKTAKAGGFLDLVFQPPRGNNLSLILAMDVGGSMEPFRHLVSLLFSAAHNTHHFKRFTYVYFHNCVYEWFYQDAALRKPIKLAEFFRQHDRETRLIMVGDAYMYPGELTDRYGSINWYEKNVEPGTTYLKRLCDFFKHNAWLNPLEERWWDSTSIRIVEDLFPMYPLTVGGVDRLARDLV